MTQPGEVEALTVLLRREYAAAWQRISDAYEALLEQWPELRESGRAQRLRSLRDLVARMADAADELAASQVLPATSGAYTLGANVTASVIGTSAVLSAIDVAAVTSLARDTYEDLLSATRGMRDTTREVVRTLARERVADRILTGVPAREAARALRRDMEGRGIAAVVYRDGSRHGLAEYADVVLLTKTAEAYQEGGFNQAERLGVDWIEIVDGPGCGLTSHDDLTLANGLLLPLEEARNYPLSHPRCRRSQLPRPDVRSREQAHAAQEAGPSVPITPADLERARQAQRESARRSAAARRLEARIARRAGGRLDPSAGASVSAAQRRADARARRRAS